MQNHGFEEDATREADNPNTYQDSPKLNLKRLWYWAKFLSIAVLAVLVLAFFGSYFSNQKLELITVIGIIGDSMGIATGILGILFYFMSERLNRESSRTLLRTEGIVKELHEQMWTMIERAFDTSLMARDDSAKKDTEEAMEEIEKEGPQELSDAASKKSVQSALDAINKRLDTLSERTRTSLPTGRINMSRSALNSDKMTISGKEIEEYNTIDGARNLAGQGQTERAISILTGLTRRGSSNVIRMEAIRSLGYLGPDGLLALERIIPRLDPPVRRFARDLYFSSTKSIERESGDS